MLESSAGERSTTSPRGGKTDTSLAGEKYKRLPMPDQTKKRGTLLQDAPKSYFCSYVNLPKLSRLRTATSLVAVRELPGGNVGAPAERARSRVVFGCVEEGAVVNRIDLNRAVITPTIARIGL